MPELGELLNQGLKEGYAGSTKRETTQRGPFQMEVSQYTSPSGGVYRDEWIADELGGGQEIVQIGDKKSTRLYGGGVAPKEILQVLGLNKKDITNKLKEFIRDSEGQTRLLQNYSSTKGEDWQYDYKIIYSLDNQEIPINWAVETIIYRGNLVFAHGFIHSPIK